MTLERIVAGLVEKIERRFYGKYRGIVVDNEDPCRLGRLRLRVPGVLGDQVVTGWAAPCAPYGGVADQGFLFVPDRDAGVWVEFEGGDLEFPIWVGTYWCRPDGDSELPRPEDADGEESDEVQDPPTRKIIKTAKGHTIQFEDADDEEIVLIREGVQGHLVTLDKNGITIVDATGNAIEMTASAFTLTAKVPLTIDASGQPVKVIADAIDLEKG
jgi:hypothetical protein